MTRTIAVLLLGLTLSSMGCGSGLTAATPTDSLELEARGRLVESPDVVQSQPHARPAGQSAPEGESERAALAMEASDAETDPSFVVVRLGLDSDANDEVGQLFEARHARLRQCLTTLHPDVEGTVLLRIYIDEDAKVAGVTAAWHILPTEGVEHLPDPLPLYADAIECMESALLDVRVILAESGEYEMELGLTIRTAPTT